MWQDCPSADRRFYQALIQAAVAVYHFERGNHAGAARLAGSGKRYMTPYRPRHCGLNVDGFWAALEEYVAPALAAGAGSSIRPQIVLEPPAGME